jgi:hypothetical protein
VDCITDAEDMERLFTSGTLRPTIMPDNIPEDKKATYVNPVCSEKLKDDGALKLRTRATIGGDRIDYPYSTTATTAELEAIKLLLNAMISECGVHHHRPGRLLFGDIVTVS